MDTEIVVHPYDGILLSNEKEQSTDTCYDMDESPKPYAECKKPVAEGYIVYNSTYRHCLGKASP